MTMETMEYTNRLYVILHPTTALIGSQLSPERLARHYTVGPTRHYRGKILFAEVDIGFRHPYFAIEAAIAGLKPHEDGRPKATKFIASYRVLEHIDFHAMKSLYLTSAEGYCLELQSGEYLDGDGESELKVYAEISPLRFLVLSRFDFIRFGGFITDPANSIGAPRFFYTQLDIDAEEFLAEYEQNPFVQSPLPNVHPAILRDAIHELRATGSKNNKGLSLRSNLDSFSYRLIRRGFMFAAQDDRRFYPIPSPAEIEKRNLKFYKSM
jgi:hypothetical protein